MLIWLVCPCWGNSLSVFTKVKTSLNIEFIASALPVHFLWPGCDRSVDPLGLLVLFIVVLPVASFSTVLNIFTAEASVCRMRQPALDWTFSKERKSPVKKTLLFTGHSPSVQRMTKSLQDIKKSPHKTASMFFLNNETYIHMFSTHEQISTGRNGEAYRKMKWN